MKSSLIIGYGNPDRQDDGVGLQALILLAREFHHAVTEPAEESFFPEGHNPDFWFDLQLKPEMANLVANYEQLCLIDAHAGEVPKDIQITEIQPSYQASILTHHMTPHTFLGLCQAVNKKIPRALLVSIKGCSFGFSRELSPLTNQLVANAIPLILDWLHEQS